MAAKHLKVKYHFSTMKRGTNVILDFHVILTGQLIYCITFMSQGHLQGQKLKSQGQLGKIIIFNK